MSDRTSSPSPASGGAGNPPDNEPDNDRAGNDPAGNDRAGGDRAGGDRAADDRAEKVSAGRRCAICGKPVEPRYRPFCSKRCADVDLGRWLGGRYAIPAVEQDDSPDAADADVTEPASGDEGSDGGAAGGR
jgi:endogenous inhibitor of DNA gyrase (YacG/DUF329 family)